MHRNKVSVTFLLPTDLADLSQALVWISNAQKSGTWQTQERGLNGFDLQIHWPWLYSAFHLSLGGSVRPLKKQNKQIGSRLEPSLSYLKSEVLSNKWGMLVPALQPVPMCRVYQFPWYEFQVLSEIEFSSQSSWKSSSQLQGSGVSWYELAPGGFWEEHPLESKAGLERAQICSLILLALCPAIGMSL